MEVRDSPGSASTCFVARPGKRRATGGTSSAAASTIRSVIGIDFLMPRRYSDTAVRESGCPSSLVRSAIHWSDFPCLAVSMACPMLLVKRSAHSVDSIAVTLGPYLTECHLMGQNVVNSIKPDQE